MQNLREHDRYGRLNGFLDIALDFIQKTRKL
jgi:hypothetical protein